MNLAPLIPKAGGPGGPGGTYNGPSDPPLEGVYPELYLIGGTGKLGVEAVEAVAAKGSLKGVEELAAAAGGKARSSGDIVVQGGRDRAKELFREFDVKGLGNRSIGRDKTGGARSVGGALEDGTPLRIRMKPDGTTRIQAGDQKFIFPSD